MDQESAHFLVETKKFPDLVLVVDFTFAFFAQNNDQQFGSKVLQTLVVLSSYFCEHDQNNDFLLLPGKRSKSFTNLSQNWEVGKCQG